MPIFIVFLGLIVSPSVWAYPEFIGYKYTSCLTCHYNPQGNGPINDYGRALWASEIAGRANAGGRSAEQLGEASGFLGSKPLPWWLRPGIKMRSLFYRPNPGGDGQTRNILMQAEGNVAVFFRQDQSLAVIASYGHAPIPQRVQGKPQAATTPEWISHEHYVRWQASENWWVSAGYTDKVYGLRIVNHTAYSRARTGLAQADQAHGVIAQKIMPTYEWTIDGFIGNLYQRDDLRQRGLSTMFEYDVAEAWRIGSSLLVSANEYVGNRRFALHSKSGLGYGSAVLAEVGLIQDAPKNGTPVKNGYYVYSEALQRLERGYHLFIAGQLYKDAMLAKRPDAFKGGFGLLMFPMQRLELRLEMENAMQLSQSANVPKDSWALMGQIHLSL